MRHILKCGEQVIRVHPIINSDVLLFTFHFVATFINRAYQRIILGLLIQEKIILILMDVAFVYKILDFVNII